jgi:hypothetical protein
MPKSGGYNPFSSQRQPSIRENGASQSRKIAVEASHLPPAWAASELTVYQLLAPSAHAFDILYDVTVTREGSLLLQPDPAGWPARLSGASRMVMSFFARPRPCLDCKGRPLAGAPAATSAGHAGMTLSRKSARVRPTRPASSPT